jgi:hypothetical protein
VRPDFCAFTGHVVEYRYLRAIRQSAILTDSRARSDLLEKAQDTEMTDSKRTHVRGLFLADLILILSLIALPTQLGVLPLVPAVSAEPMVSSQPIWQASLAQAISGYPHPGRGPSALGLSSPPAADPCEPISGENYAQISINPPPTDRPAERHADLNLIVRGYTPTSAPKDLVFYYGDTDRGAPQLSGLFGDDRIPRISSVYRVFEWNWGEDCRGQSIGKPEVSLMGVEANPGEILYVPPAKYTIGSGFDVMVLYASPLRMTLKYTREDNVVSGYTVHLENICVEPRLLALYQACNNAGRGNLPALKAGQAIGRSRGKELGIAIRDNGVFMDPRSSKDWWSR